MILILKIDQQFLGFKEINKSSYRFKKLSLKLEFLRQFSLTIFNIFKTKLFLEMLSLHEMEPILENNSSKEDTPEALHTLFLLKTKIFVFVLVLTRLSSGYNY